MLSQKTSGLLDGRTLSRTGEQGGFGAKVAIIPGTCWPIFPVSRAGQGASRMASKQGNYGEDPGKRLPTYCRRALSSRLMILSHRLMQIKDTTEIANIPACRGNRGERPADMLHLIRPGVRERDLAGRLEYRMSRGGVRTSLPSRPLLLSGYRSGHSPHGRASEKKVQKGDFIYFRFLCYRKRFTYQTLPHRRLSAKPRGARGKCITWSEGARCRIAKAAS